MTTVTSRDPKGLQATALFESLYNKAGLNDDAAQRLNESAPFAAYLAEGIRKHSLPIPHNAELLSIADPVPAGRLEEAFTFETRDGLYIYDDEPMRELLADGATVDPQDVAGMTGLDLLQDGSDNDITSGGPISEVTRAQIAAAIKAQWGGTPGPLLTNGYWNIFYVGGLVVSVYWGAGLGFWHVSAWRRGAHVWYAERRAFSGN